MKNFSHKHVFFLGALMLLAGCGKYEPQTFRAPREPEVEKRGISVKAHQLTKEEYRSYFTPSKRLLGKDPVLKDYVPIQLHITNNSNKAYVLSGNNISALPELKENIATRMYYTSSTLPMFLGDPNYKQTARDEEKRLKKTNEKIDKDIEKRVIDSEIELVIRPGTSVNKVFFVFARGFKTPFTIKLVDEKNKEPLIFELFV